MPGDEPLIHPVDDTLPKVSILIPTLNRVDYLRSALESALAQTYRNLEIVISDNVSDDDTWGYLKSVSDKRITLLRQTIRLSMTENWNRCLAPASGEYFLLLSDDDLLEPDAIAELVSRYRRTKGPAPGIVYCGGSIIDSAGATVRTFSLSPEWESTRTFLPAFVSRKREVWLCGVLYRASVLKNGFSREFAAAADTAAIIESVIRYDGAAYVPRSLVKYRAHQANLTSSTSLRLWLDEYELLRSHFLAGYRAAGLQAPDLLRDVDKNFKRVMTGIIPNRINRACNGDRMKLIKEYIYWSPRMMSPFGMRVMARGILSGILGDRFKAGLRKLLRRRNLS